MIPSVIWRFRLPLTLLALFAAMLGYALYQRGMSKRHAAAAEAAQAAARGEAARADLSQTAGSINDRRTHLETQARNTAQEATDGIQSAPADRLVPGYLDALRELRDEAASARAPSGASGEEPPRAMPPP